MTRIQKHIFAVRLLTAMDQLMRDLIACCLSRRLVTYYSAD